MPAASYSCFAARLSGEKLIWTPRSSACVASRPMDRKSIGILAQSRATSLEAMMIAAAPPLILQTSYSRNGQINEGLLP